MAQETQQNYTLGPGGVKTPVIAPALQQQIDAYKAKLGGFNSQLVDLRTKYGETEYWKRPEFQAAYADTDALYNSTVSALKAAKVPDKSYHQSGQFHGYGVTAPNYDRGRKTGLGGIGSLLKIGAPLALSFLAPGIGTSIGTALGATGASAGALGGALLGAGTGFATGGGLKGALLGGVTGGAGGYLNSGGFSDLTDGFGLGDLFGSTSLSGTQSATSGFQLGDDLGGALDLSALTNPADDYAQSVATASASPWGTAPGITSTAQGGTMGTFWDDALSGLKKQFDPAGMAGGLAKGALGMALSKSPDGGYRAMQDAANANKLLYEPYLRDGAAAQGLLASALTGDGTAATANFRASPSYNFARQQGIDALDASAARRGMLLSDNQTAAVQEFGTGLADQEWDEYLARLQQQAGVGYQAAGDTGNANNFAAQAEALRKKQKADTFNGLLAQALFPRQQSSFFA